jgi:hypothetical protein
MRARRVFEVAEEYRRLLRERSLVDPAEVLWEATRECGSSIPLLVWGYPRFGRDELAFIDAVAAEGSEVRLPWAEDSIFGANLEAARELESRGWSVKEGPLKSVWEPAATVEAFEYPYLEAEVRGTLARVKALLVEGVPQDDIVIVARDDSFYGPTVLSVAKEYGVPVRLLYRVTVADTRVGAWLKMLFEAAEEGFPFEITARLLAHPLGPGLSWKGWAEARRVRSSGSASWEECGVKLEHLDLPHIWPDEDARAGWTRRFEELLRACDLRSRVGSARREIVALARLREGVGWLAAPEEEVISRERFLAEIFEAMSVTATPAYPEGEGVALHTPLSLFGARYRHVFVLGLAEGTLPAPVSEDSTLDFYERKLLKEEGIHLELAAERARRANGEDTGDLLSMLLRFRNEEGGGMSDKQLRDEVLTLLLAGHETTALALSWAWYLLSLHPKAEARLLWELQEVLGDRAPTVEDLPRLPYAEMVIKESMRLYPPAWGVSREAIEECEIGGYSVPAGTQVLIVLWAMHRDPRYFEDPETFEPARWEGALTKRVPRYAYLPFGAGPRVFIGGSFAMTEAILLLVTIAKGFRLELVPEQRGVIPQPSTTLRPKGGIRMRLTSRYFNAKLTLEQKA